VLTGASVRQLRHWNRTRLLVPEVATGSRLRYSFRDVVALRTVVRLRAETSLQRIRRAFTTMPDLDFTEHPSRYRFGTDGHTIALADEDGHLVDLLASPGQYEIISLADIFQPFQNRRGETVVDFLHPRDRLEVRAGRMGGWPTIADTRIPYDTIAELVSGEDVTVDDVDYYYPGVDAQAARDAVDFHAAVRGVA
jgi:uncharacterized protein (DUF433 family)/DNA-binding transcriptional MerR regulator